MASIRTIMPSEITDRNLRGVAERVTDKISLAGQRALLSKTGRQVKMPSGSNTIEHSFATFFNELPAEVTRLAAQKMESSGNRGIVLPFAATGNSRIYQQLDLAGTRSVAAQLAGASVAFRNYAREDEAAGTSRTLKGNWPGTGTSTLRWRVTELHCEVETGLTAWGSDHVYMQGVMIDAFGNSVPTGVADLEGDWDSGDKMGWPDRTLGTMNMDYGSGWARPCILVAAISTKSAGGLMALMDRIVKEAKEEVVQYVTAAAGAYAGAMIGGAIGTIGGPVGMAIGAAIGALVGSVVAYVIDKVWGWLVSLFQGEKLFTPITMSVDVAYHGAKWNNSLVSGTHWPVWVGHSGRYKAKIDAVLSWGAATVPASISLYKGTINLFKTDKANKVVTRSWEDNAWSTWYQIAGGMASGDAPVTAAKYDGNKICVLTTGLDGRVWSYDVRVRVPGGPPPIRVPGQTWQPLLEGTFLLGTTVAGVSREKGYVDVFMAGKDGQVWSASRGPQTGNVWQGWWVVGNMKVPAGAPIAAVSRSKAVLDIFVTGYDGLVYSTSWGQHTGWNWGNWFTFSNRKFIPGIGITAVSRKENQLDLFAVDAEGIPCVASWSPATGWQDWKAITNGKFPPGTTLAEACYTPENMDIFGVSSDGRVWTAAYGPHLSGKWAGWWAIGDRTFPVGTPVTATSVQPGVLNIFIDDTAGNTLSAAHDGRSWTWYDNW